MTSRLVLYTIEVILFDKLIDYLNYKNADFSWYEWYENGFKYVKDDYIIKECGSLRHSKKFEILTNDSVNPNDSVYPYARLFFWYYTNAREEDRCYLKENAIYDKIFFVFKRKSEVSFVPVAYFDTLDEAEKYVANGS
jgi:spore cortex formation protein SpoVR/YcgB (stage V sporulation)